MMGSRLLIWLSLGQINATLLNCVTKIFTSNGVVPAIGPNYRLPDFGK
jgi:hypothetical protein